MIPTEGEIMQMNKEELVRLLRENAGRCTEVTRMYNNGRGVPIQFLTDRLFMSYELLNRTADKIEKERWPKTLD
jgi:hypothetical protein